MGNESTEFARQTAANTGDKPALLQEELVLSASAQKPAFTGIKKSDVYSIELRVRKVGSPTDSGYLANFTIVSGDIPTTTHGQYLGNGDIYEVTGQVNVNNLQIISADGGFHVCHIIYYGKSQN